MLTPNRYLFAKGPKTWTEIAQTIRLHQNKNIFSRLLKKTIISPSTTKCIAFIIYINCCELSLFYRSVVAMHVCVVAVCVASRGGCAWVRLVCLLPVLMSCVRSCSGWVRPAFSQWWSLVLPRISECAHGRWAKPSISLACLL